MSGLRREAHAEFWAGLLLGFFLLLRASEFCTGALKWRDVTIFSGGVRVIVARQSSNKPSRRNLWASARTAYVEEELQPCWLVECPRPSSCRSGGGPPAWRDYIDLSAEQQLFVLRSLQLISGLA